MKQNTNNNNNKINNNNNTTSKLLYITNNRCLCRLEIRQPSIQKSDSKPLHGLHEVRGDEAYGGLLAVVQVRVLQAEVESGDENILVLV